MSAVVPMPVVRPMVGRRSAAARRREDLLGRVHLAVRMARRSLKRALAEEEGAATGAAGGGGAPAPLVLAKVVGEAAMLLRMAANLRGEDETLDVESRLLAVQLVAPARGARVKARLCHDTGRALEHASAHLFLGDAGYPDEAFDRLLDELLEGEVAGGAERLPNHQLECEWLDQLRRGRVDVEPIDAELLAATCIGWPLDVLACSTLDLYMFTHVVLYASDMGRRPVRLPRPVDEVLAEAEAGLAAALDADNFDLAAELLWTWPMLDRPWSAAAVFAFDLLSTVQDEFGFLPGPEHARWAAEPVPGLARDEMVLRTSYHATLVMGMLCAATLRPGAAPPAAIASRVSLVPPSSRGMPAPLMSSASLASPPRRVAAPVGDTGWLARLPPRAPTPRWQQAFERLDASRQAALTSLCFNVWFRRAAAGDLAQLREALAGTLEHGSGDGPSARQALMRLRRTTAVARSSPPA